MARTYLHACCYVFESRFLAGTVYPISMTFGIVK